MNRLRATTLQFILVFLFVHHCFTSDARMERNIFSSPMTLGTTKLFCTAVLSTGTLSYCHRIQLLRRMSLGNAIPDETNKKIDAKLISGIVCRFSSKVRFVQMFALPVALAFKFLSTSSLELVETDFSESQFLLGKKQFDGARWNEKPCLKMSAFILVGTYMLLFHSEKMQKHRTIKRRW